MTNQSIAQRNNQLHSLFTPVTPSAIVSDFRVVRGATNLTGDRRFVYISDRSVTVVGDALPIFYRKCFPPGQTKVISGGHTENDKTLILSNGHIYRYTTAKKDNTTDIPDQVSNIQGFLQGGTPKDLLVFPAALGGRVLGVPTDKGLLLLYYQEADMVLLDQLFINTHNGLMYGADDVLWARGSGVESTRRGRILIGSSSKGSYFETLVDLDSRSIIGSWDEMSLLNKRPGTGEILYATEGYSGIPSAPKLKTILVTSSGASLLLNWSQERPDVVAKYEIQVSRDGMDWALTATTPSGAIRTYEFRDYHNSSDYRFRVRAINQEGPGPWSNEAGLVKSGKVCEYGNPSGRGLTLKPTEALPPPATTTTPSTRNNFSLMAYPFSGTATWSKVLDPSLLGGGFLTFTGDGGTQKIQGDIHLADYSLVCIGHKVTQDSQGFVFSIDNWTQSVPPGADNSGWVETQLGDTLLPPGTYQFSVMFPSAPVGRVGYVGYISLLPPVSSDTRFRGRHWINPESSSILLKGWNKVFPPVAEDLLPTDFYRYFPDSVTTITGDSAQSAQSASSTATFGVNLTKPTQFFLHGTSEERPVRVTHNGKVLTMVEPRYRIPASFDVPPGLGVVQLFGAPGDVLTLFGSGDKDGWTVQGTAGLWMNDNLLVVTNPTPGDKSYLVAPPKFHGDLSQFLGATLQWRYNIQSTLAPKPEQLVLSTLALGDITWKGATPTPKTWSVGVCKLQGGSFVDSSGREVTTDNLALALKSVLGIKLVVDSVEKSEVTWVDWVKLGFGPIPAPASSAITPVGKLTRSITLRANGEFSLEGSRIVPDRNGEGVNTLYARTTKTPTTKMDIQVTLDHLRDRLPLLDMVYIQVPWFCKRVDGGPWKIYPGIGPSMKSRVDSTSAKWSVKGMTWDTARVLSYDHPGTPSDTAVYWLMEALRERGYDVGFQPLLIHDAPPKDQIYRGAYDFQGMEDHMEFSAAYSEYLLHYATLLKGTHLSHFCLGSELGLALTSYAPFFPLAGTLNSLVGDIRTLMPLTKVFYAHNEDDTWVALPGESYFLPDFMPNTDLFGVAGSPSLAPKVTTKIPALQGGVLGGPYNPNPRYQLHPDAGSVKGGCFRSTSKGDGSGKDLYTTPTPGMEIRDAIKLRNSYHYNLYPNNHTTLASSILGGSPLEFKGGPAEFTPSPLDKTGGSSLTPLMGGVTLTPGHTMTGLINMPREFKLEVQLSIQVLPGKDALLVDVTDTFALEVQSGKLVAKFASGSGPRVTTPGLAFSSDTPLIVTFEHLTTGWHFSVEDSSGKIAHSGLDPLRPKDSLGAPLTINSGDFTMKLLSLRQYLGTSPSLWIPNAVVALTTPASLTKPVIIMDVCAPAIHGASTDPYMEPDFRRSDPLGPWNSNFTRAGDEQSAVLEALMSTYSKWNANQVVLSYVDSRPYEAILGAKQGALPYWTDNVNEPYSRNVAGKITLEG